MSDIDDLDRIIRHHLGPDGNTPSLQKRIASIERRLNIEGSGGAVSPEAEQWLLDALAAANRSGIVPPSAEPEPPRSVGELIERNGDLFLCLNLSAIGAQS